MQAIQSEPGFWNVLGGFNEYEIVEGDEGSVVICDINARVLRVVAGGVTEALEACGEIDKEAERVYRLAVSYEVWKGHCGDKDDD